MSDGMDFIIDHFLKQRGLTPALPKRNGVRMICAGVISVRSLFVVAVEATADGSFNLINRKCKEFELRDRSQDAIRKFAYDIGRVASLVKSSRFILRAAAESGQYPASPFAYKVEAALQLLPTLDVRLVATNSIAHWVNKVAPKLPSPDHDRLDLPKAKQQLRAIEAAAFAYHHWNDPRYFRSEV